MTLSHMRKNYLQKIFYLCIVYVQYYISWRFMICYCLGYCLVPKFCLTLCNPVDCSMPGSPDRYCLPEYAQTMSIELMTPSNHLDLSHSLLFLPSIFPSIRVFSSESTVCIRWPKYWSLNLSISPSNIVIHNFIRLYSIYSHYKILAIFLLLYNISL